MQNIGAPKSLDTNLNTASSEVELRSEQPLLRKALSDNFCKSLDEDEEQLDGIVELTNKTTIVVEEQSPKSKTRSRFSSAFRSFRASKSSKKNKSIPSSSDQVLSSGGEDLELPQLESIDTKKKKSKLSKKFSLAGIKKNKVNPKKEDEITSSNLLLVTSSTQTTQTLDRRPLFVADNESKRKVTTVTSPPDPSTPPYSLSPESSPTKFDKVRKIQITIQGKKIEHTNKNNNNWQQWRKNLPTTTTEIIGTSAPSPSNTDEGDYLTAIATDEPRPEQQQQQKPVITTPFKKNSKRNKKPRSKPNSPPTSPSASPSGNKSITSTISTTTTTEEKFVVTQSICDTPPLERAPAKPSRVAAGLIPSSSITTPSPSTASVSATASAPTGAIRKSLSHQIPKLKRQRSHVIDPSESESYFMIREGTVERGRRFPRPASIENHDLSPLLAAQSQSLPAPLGIPAADANLQLPPPPPTTTTTTTAEADVEQKSLPPSVEETNQEPHETINQQQRKIISLPSLASTSSIHSTFEIENLPTDTDITATTTIIPTNSSYYFSGNNIQNPNLSGIIKDQSLEDTNNSGSIEETPIICDHQHNIRFAVGNPVRPLRTIPLSQIDSKDFSSFGSDKSFGSDQSPTSESSIHRRRIRYVNQPSVYTEEERDILDGKREALNYLSGISEYSFDSEFSVSDPPQMPAFGDLTMDQEDPPIMTSSQEKREHLYKILVIGELGTGKTSFIKRYVHQFFSQNYRATIGVDFALKVLHWDSNTIVRLQLWDIAGQERFGNMTRVYYKEAVGAFIVFDVTRSGTFDCVSKWKEDLDSKVQLPDGSPIPCILLANKCDQDKQGIITTPEKMDEYVRENGFAGWFETSAKENVNIDEAARALVNKILLNDKLISDADIADSEKFNLANSNGGQTTTQAIKSKCSC